MIKIKQILRMLTCLFLFTFTITFTFSMADANVLTLSDEELSSHFIIKFGSASLLTITDVSGLGVEFSATDINLYESAYKLGVSDEYPVSDLAGGTGLHDANFTEYDSYEMFFENIGTTEVNVSLFMNTGFTGTSGISYADTFWGGSWVTISPDETQMATLDFNSAETWGAEDELDEAWQYTNGTWNPIFRLDQVTNIGFQVIPASGTSADLIVSAVPIPSALLLFSSGILGLLSFRKKISL